MRRIALMLVFAVLLVGCSVQPREPAVDAKGQDSFQVLISDFEFKPAVLSVFPGATIEWANKDAVPHTATGSGFDSALISPGGKWSRKFDQAGVFEYYCSIHPSMRGRIIVE